LSVIVAGGVKGVEGVEGIEDVEGIESVEGVVRSFSALHVRAREPQIFRPRNFS
jgi:hypothetical protein